MAKKKVTSVKTKKATRTAAKAAPEKAVVGKKNAKKTALKKGLPTKAPARKPANKVAAASTANVLTGVLQAGAKVPAFSLQASDGSTVSLAGLAGSRAVLYFYPRADTPGCTVEACGFRDAIAGYKALGVPVFGISPDPIKDVAKFAAKFDLNFPLLADEDHKMCEAFGVWVEKSMYGKKYFGAARTTFVIDAQGKIEKVFEKVQPDGHDKEVLAYLKS